MTPPADLTLHLNFPKIIIASTPSHFQIGLMNRSERPLEGVVLSFESEDFDPPLVTIELDGVPPGGQVERLVSITPARVSARPIACTLECLHGSEPRSLCGAWPGLTIFEKPSSQISITNIVQDIQSHRGEGEKAGYGAINGDVSVNLTSHLGEVRTLNDLLAITLPPAWHEVPLRSLTSTTLRRISDRRRIPSAFLRVYEPMQALSLRPADAGLLSSTDATARGWRLLGGVTSQLILGRSSADCDLVTRFMPPDEANDGKSSGLSRRHARLSVAESGQLQVENVSSGNVVLAGRSAVAVGAASPLSGNEVLALGTPPADLRLNFTLAPAVGNEVKITNFEQWQGYNASRHLPPARYSWGHAQIQWLNTTPAFWQPVWFGRCVAFGSAPESPICLEDSGLDPCHGFIHHFSGCYWLEVISERPGVRIEDPQNAALSGPQPVPPGVLIPLRSHMLLTFGIQVFRLMKAA